MLSISNNKSQSISKARAMLKAAMSSLNLVETSESNENIAELLEGRIEWLLRTVETGYPMNLMDSTEKSRTVSHLSRFGHNSSAITLLDQPNTDCLRSVLDEETLIEEL